MLLLQSHVHAKRSEDRQQLCAAIRSLKLRMRLSHRVEEVRRQGAMEVLSRYVKGIYLRTGRVFDWEAYCRKSGRRVTDEIRERMVLDKEEVELARRVRLHTSRVRREIEDEQQQMRHFSALRLQRSWRAREARLKELLPRLASRLAAERRLLLAMQRHEGQASGRGLRPTHLQIISARPCPPVGWMRSVGEVPDTMVDMDTAESFAMVVANGTAYCLPGHDGCGTIGSPEAVSLAGPFVLHHLRSLAETPKVLQVSCGLHHALLLAEGGLAFAWGLNDCGQCGVGWPRAKTPQQVVAEATCLQPWAALYSVSAEEMKTAGLLEPRKGDSLTSACISGAVLPRLKSLCCGPSSSMALDLESQLWGWGSAALGMPCLMPLNAPRPPKSRGTLRVQSSGLTACPFLLYEVAGKEPATRQELLSKLDLKELPGHVLAPTLACNINLREGAVSSAPTDTVLLCKAGRSLAVLAPTWGETGAARAESTFSSIACGQVNFAVTSRGVLYSWSSKSHVLLARSSTPTPAPVPTFVRLAACVSSVSVGSDHALALTSHGRVFAGVNWRHVPTVRDFRGAQCPSPFVYRELWQV